MRVVLWITVAVVWGCGVCAQVSRDLPPLSYSHRVVLDQDGVFVMLWTPNNDTIDIQVQVGAKGYVGLGFSPTGGMKGADIVLGWVDAGKVFLQDRYAEGNWAPRIDESQDVKLLDGYENNTHTVLMFSRPWDTCDKSQDLALTDDTVRVIWAYSDRDPVSVTDLHYHQARGTKSLYLKSPQFVMPQMGPDVKTWDFLLPNVSLPDDLDTLYWCKIFKMPPTPVKSHMIGYIPLIEEGNVEYVHHILFYECYVPDSKSHFEKWLPWDGTQCRTANMPVSWKYCKSPIVVWAIGGEGEMFPEHAGFPMGEEHGGSTYFMMEMHYDNPNLRQGVVDSSGVRIFYTETLRDYDAGNMMFGHSVNYLHIVPPGQSQFITSGFCDMNCTQQELPEGGVKIFQGLLHSHLLGTSLVLRHIRNGQELPPIMKDMTYDFNYQSTRILHKEVTVLPGDILITECIYDSSKLSKPTFGGLDTRDEMCLAFMSYYPRVNLFACVSLPQEKDIFGAVGVNYTHEEQNSISDDGTEKLTESEMITKIKSGSFTQELKPLKLSHQFKSIRITGPKKFANMSAFSVLHNEAIWRDPAVVDSFQRMTTSGVHTSICATRDADKIQQGIELSPYPSFIAVSPEPDQCFTSDGF